MSAARKNSPFGAYTGGVTASAAVPTTQTGIRSAGDMAPPVASQATAPATVKSHVTAGIVRLQSNAGYANANRPRANAEDAGVTSPGGEQPGTLSHRAGLNRPIVGLATAPLVSTRESDVPFRDHARRRHQPPVRECVARPGLPRRLGGASPSLTAADSSHAANSRPLGSAGGRPFCSRDRLSRQAVDPASVLRSPFHFLLHVCFPGLCSPINTDGFAHVQKVFAETANA